MTEILNTCIHSPWFWVVSYFVGVCLTYYLLYKFDLNKNWGAGNAYDVEIHKDVNSILASIVWVFTLLIFIVGWLCSLVFSMLRKIATADHPEEDKTDSK